MQRTAKDFSWLITNKSVTVSFEGNSHTVLRDEKNCDALIKAIKEGLWDEIPKILSPELAVANMSDGDMRVDGGQVFVKTSTGDFAVPSGLNSTIIKYIDEGLPFKPLVKFAANLSENPSFRSVEQLFNFLEKNNFTITDEGKFIAYKSIRADFKDVHSGKFDNSVGQTVQMPRNEVDEDPNRTCSKGLHVANYNYAHNIYGGPVTVFVEVHPKNVVAVPVDYSNAKMRVCEYKVLGISKGEIKDPIYNCVPEEDADGDFDFDNEEGLQNCSRCATPNTFNSTECCNCGETL